MPTSAQQAPAAEGRHSALLCQVGALVCGLPLPYIIETLRPLALASFEGMPNFVMGLSIIRGAPVPVVHLGRLLENRGTTCGRWVLACAEGHHVALAVERVIGVRSLPAPTLGALPPLLGEASADIISRVGSLDTRLLVMLESARILPQSTWASLQMGGGPA